MVSFQKGRGRIWQWGGRGERKGHSMKYRPVGLILIPGRTRERIVTGWSVRSGTRNQWLPRGCPLSHKSPQSNLVSSPDMVIRLGDGQTGISAGRLTGLLRVLLWMRWRNGGGTRARISEFVTGWTSIFKVLMSRVMSPRKGDTAPVPRGSVFGPVRSARCSVAWTVSEDPCLLVHWRA